MTWTPRPAKCCGQRIFGEPPAATVAGHHRHAILILDVSGIIRFSATRRLFGRSDDELTDSHLQWFIPTLPMRENTPGYNVAYVRLAFAERGWQRHRRGVGRTRPFPGRGVRAGAVDRTQLRPAGRHSGGSQRRSRRPPRPHELADSIAFGPYFGGLTPCPNQG